MIDDNVKKKPDQYTRGDGSVIDSTKGTDANNMKIAQKTNMILLLIFVIQTIGIRKAMTIISRLGNGATRLGCMKTTSLSINIGKHGKRMFVVRVSSKSLNSSELFIYTFAI